MTTAAADPSEVPPWGQEPLFDLPDRARLRTAREVAELANVHRNAVYAAIGAGDLRASKPAGEWRISLADAERWIRSTEANTRTETEPAPGTRTPEAGREDGDR